MQAQTEPLSDSVSHFKILERLGRGGTGVVYKAIDLRLLRTVALKFLAPDRGASEEDRRRFLREARAASSLDHPNICTLYEIGEAADGRLFLAMALCEGETLARRIERGPLPLGLAIDLALQVAAGLGAAHEKGIVHRDVKPGNLIVTPGGRLKIVDFGIARRADQTQLTHAGMALGTTVYMSPEQLRGEEIDPRTDLWSLGVVLYEMVTGDIPWDGVETEVVASILKRTPRPLGAQRPGVPEALERIVARALAKPRGQRYASAAELLAALASVVLPVEAPLPELEETLIEITPTGTRPPGERFVEEVLPAGLALGSMVAHFRVIAPLGGGGMGVVYRAEDTRLGRTVALKFLAPERTRDPAAKERFLQEARAASALDHPNLCTVHEVGETAEERLFLAMPCYDGETLARRIERGPLAVAEAVELAGQAARGLAKAHRGGIVHRDVKPANLMVTGDGVVKILDFGIAELAGPPADFVDPGPAGPAGPAVVGGGLAGTPAYMSPEQTRREAVGPATDVWSLGVVLYEMLTGSRPFAGGSAAAVFHAIREGEPEPLPRRRPEVPAELSRIVSRMLAKDPNERYPTAVEAFADLDRLGSGLATGQSSRQAGDRAWPLGALALLLVLLVGAGAWLWQRGGSVRAPIRATFTHLTDQEGRESFPSLSPDGGSVVYAKTMGGRSHLYLQQVGQGTPRDLSAAAPGDDTQPAYSPDGRQIAFRSEREGGGIFVMGSAGGPARRLTSFGYNPAWSPDGREIALATEGVEDPGSRQTNSDLWRVEVATGAERLVVGGADAVQPSWAPHGRRIAYWGLPPGSAERVLWTVPVAGGTPSRVTDDAHLNWNPVWSPDGSYLYFGSDRGGSMNLWRLPVDEATGKARGEAEPITTPAQWSGFWSLSRDGRRMAYSTDDTRANLERLPFDPLRLAVSGPAVELTRGAQAVDSAELSPDGRSIVFDNLVPQEDLFVMNTASGRILQLTNDRFKDRRPTWSPDGKLLLFYSNRSGRYEAWTIRPDGSGLMQVTNTDGGALTRPIWSPDGRRLACSIGSRGPALFDLTEPIERRRARFLPAVGEGWSFSASSWSPDGLKLAGSMSNLGSHSLGLYSLSSGRYERLVDGGSEPVWLADGRALLYLDKGGVDSLDLPTREVRQVLPPTPDAAIPSLSVSRDGRALYVVRARYEGDVWILKLNGH